VAKSIITWRIISAAAGIAAAHVKIRPGKTRAASYQYRQHERRIHRIGVKASSVIGQKKRNNRQSARGERNINNACSTLAYWHLSAQQR